MVAVKVSYSTNTMKKRCTHWDLNSRQVLTITPQDYWVLTTL